MRTVHLGTTKLYPARRYAVAGIALVLTMAGISLATPFNYGEGVEPLRWPANKTIRIYIQADPVATPPDVSALLQQGMQRWAAEMAPRGITIEVNVGDPPVPPPTNVVPCTYEADGTHHPNDPKGEGPALGNENDGIAGCDSPGGSGHIERAAIIVRRDLWAASGTDSMGNPNGLTDAEREEYIRNLGQHEVTHVLGLADDTAGTVTDHVQTETPNTFNDRDRQEINTLYPLLKQPAPRAEGQRQNIPDPNFHQYNFHYQGSPFDHVPLIMLDIEPQLIVQIQAPPGWAVLNPADPNRTNLNHPYYQGYLEDGRPSPAPYDADASPPLAIRAIGNNPGMTAQNPNFGFMVVTQGANLGTIAVWAGGQVQFLPGPVPPGFALGDMNCDGIVSVGDIAGFVLALTNPAGYAAAFPGCDINLADINGDMQVSVSDIGPFVQLLTGG